MRSILSRSALLAMLVALSLPVAAQKVKIENQGEASNTAEARTLTAEAVEKAVGKAPDGKSQVVFFRSARSPGAAITVNENADPRVELDPGMFYVVATTPGAHAYSTSDGGKYDGTLETGKTYYVQVIRNKAGHAQLLRSSPDKFQRASR